jgi:MFS family permease
LVSQSAHFVAAYCLRVLVVLQLAADGATQRDTAWHLVSALVLLPSVFLVPVNGAIGNSLPKRILLVGSAAHCLLIVILFAWRGRGWPVCVVGFALGSALFGPTRHALLPPAAQDSGLALSRVVSMTETAAVLSIVGGMVLGGALTPIGWPEVAATLWLTEHWTSALRSCQVPVVVVVIIGLNAICLVFAIPTYFEADVCRRESPRAALRGFFRDLSGLVALQPARSSLLAICVLRSLVTAMAGTLIAKSLASGSSAASPYQTFIVVAVLTMVGAAGGSFLGGLIGDRSRLLSLVPLAVTGTVVALCWVAMSPAAPTWCCVLLGAFGGIVNVPLLAMYQESLPPDARGNGMAILNTAGLVAMTIMSLLMAGLASAGVLTASGQLWLIAGLSVLATVAAWRSWGTATLNWLGIFQNHHRLRSKSPE